MPLKGARAHIRRLNRLASPGGLGPVGEALFAGGEEIQVEAQLSITAGAVSGRGFPALMSSAPWPKLMCMSFSSSTMTFVAIFRFVTTEIRDSDSPAGSIHTPISTPMLRKFAPTAPSR